jgi:DNA-binding CsgD family transcriptional regulator
MNTPVKAHDDLPITDADARDIIRLIGEVIAAPGDHAAKKRLLMDSLCRLVDADFWFWSMVLHDVGKHDPVWAHALSGGFSEGQYPAVMQALDHPVTGVIHGEIAAAVASTRKHITRTRAQFDPTDRAGFRDPGGVWANAGIADLMASYRMVRPDALSGLGLYRRLGRPDFDARELRIAHIVLSEVPWLHESGWPENRIEERELPKLSRRERTVLLSLVNAETPKSIATALKVSAHTVNDYIQAVYRHFGVNSRAQLLGKFTKGDGGDRV